MKRRHPFPRIIINCGSLDELIVPILQLTDRYVITLVRSFAELTSILQESDYDLLLLHLSAKSTETLPNIHKVLSIMPGIKIILLNGEPDQSLLVEAFHLGVSDYFAKPVNGELLVERVMKVISLENESPE